MVWYKLLLLLLSTVSRALQSLVIECVLKNVDNNTEKASNNRHVSHDTIPLYKPEDELKGLKYLDLVTVAQLKLLAHELSINFSTISK